LGSGVAANICPIRSGISSSAGKENLAMHIPSTIRLSTGRAHLAVRPMIRVSVTAHELDTLACAVARDAEDARAEGRHHVADQLDWRAAVLREAAR